MLQRLLALLLGLLAGVFAFEALSRLLSGVPFGWLWHSGVAAGALLGLWLAARTGRTRLTLIAGSLALLGLTAASAFVFPALVRAWAERAAAGNSWCLVGHDIRNGTYQPDKLSYLVAAPLVRHDLSYLTRPDPLLLVVASDAGAADELSADGDDPALQVWRLDLARRGFTGPELPVLDLDRPSMLLDCVPAADPFANAADPETHPIVVIWRPVLTGADGTARLGPRRHDVFHLPAGAVPLRGSRLVSPAFGVSLMLKPEAAAMLVELRFRADPVASLRGDLGRHLRDGDQSLDFASLPLDAFGLHALEYPSTSVDGAIQGVYTALAPDRTPKTLINCDEFTCNHRFRPDLPGGLPVVVLVTYPLDLRADWQATEKTAKAEVMAMLQPR